MKEMFQGLCYQENENYSSNAGYLSGMNRPQGLPVQATNRVEQWRFVQATEYPAANWLKSRYTR